MNSISFISLTFPSITIQSGHLSDYSGSPMFPRSDSKIVSEKPTLDRYVCYSPEAENG